MGYLYTHEKDIIYSRLCKILTSENTSDELFCQATTALCLLLDTKEYFNENQSQHGEEGIRELVSFLRTLENSSD